MANDYLKLNDTNMNIVKAQNLMASIESKRRDSTEKKEVQSEDGVFSELMKSFKDFFTNLGKPTVQKRFQKNGSPPYSKDYNSTMKEICDDIKLSFKEEDSLSSIIVRDFNYSEAERQMLLNKVRKLSSNTIDYSLYTQLSKDQSLFAKDSFLDNSKLDSDRLTAGYTAAEVDLHQGCVTLKRTSNIDKSPNVTKVTGVKEGLTKWDYSTSTGGYEGCYWALSNEARPEGGKWHLQYTQDGSSLYELGASEDELQPIRMKMFDGNANTFWEVESVTTPIVGYKDKFSGAQISVDEFNALFNNELSSIKGDIISTDDGGSLIERYVPVMDSSDTTYLTVNFTVNFSKPETINWITLNPNNFGQEMYMQILSIETSPDGSSFENLEQFDDYEYSNTLTSEANSELSDELVSETLSPDRFKYAGQGLWIFSPRTVAAIRFTIRQPRAYLKSYDVLMVETKQTITSVTTKKIIFKADKTVTDSHVETRVVAVPYLIGQVTGFDVMNLEAGDTSISSGTGSTIEQQATGAVAGFTIGGLVGGPIGAIVGGVLGFLFGGLFGSSTQTTTTVGPQTISRQWTVTKNDKSRFAIGIRDINLYSYEFSELSEIISRPFTSPLPISKVSLSTEEQIPKIFYTGDLRGTENDWIKYYISVDDGVSWKRISPSHHRDTLSEDGKNFVPNIININSDISINDRENSLAYIDVGQPVYNIRFRAVLSRPTAINSAASYSPVLNSYSLQLYPFGGL